MKLMDDTEFRMRLITALERIAKALETEIKNEDVHTY